MANGELINGLDYDAISHIHPFAIPPALAIGESIRASGRDLILSTVIAQEVAKRFVMALSNMLAKLTSEAKTPDVFGNSNECIFGGTAGAARLLNLGANETAHAIGISAYLCPLPVCRDWEATVPKSMIKYVSAGWVCYTSVTSALLAREGYTGNPRVFDGEYGFARFYGAERWAPELVVDKLGDEWRFMEMAYKPYPCCRFFHAQLDCFIDLIEKNNLPAEEIVAVRYYGAASNLFAVVEGILVTPPKGHELLPRSTRDMVLELAPWNEESKRRSDRSRLPNFSPRLKLANELDAGNHAGDGAGVRRRRVRPLVPALANIFHGLCRTVGLQTRAGMAGVPLPISTAVSDKRFCADGMSMGYR